MGTQFHWQERPARVSTLTNLHFRLLSSKYGRRQYLQSLGVINSSDSESTSEQAETPHPEPSMPRRREFNRQASPLRLSDGGSGESTPGPQSRLRSVLASQESELPEFRCSICGECQDIRNRPSHYRQQYIFTPPVLRTEVRRAPQVDAGETHRTRSYLDNPTYWFCLASGGP